MNHSHLPSVSSCGDLGAEKVSQDVCWVLPPAGSSHRFHKTGTEWMEGKPLPEEKSLHGTVHGAGGCSGGWTQLGR